MLQQHFRMFYACIDKKPMNGRADLFVEKLGQPALGETDFDRFPIPYRAVATDLANGNAVVLKSGSLATAMRASMSLPGIFPPVELDGKELSDGGMAANFPIRIFLSAPPVKCGSRTLCFGSLPIAKFM